MTFRVIDKKTGKEPTRRVIQNIAKQGGLMEMDIDQFFIGEDGALVLMDDCGNMTYCDNERFEVIIDKEESEHQCLFPLMYDEGIEVAKRELSRIY